MSDVKLGEAPDVVGTRDAVHVPIISASAGEDFWGGALVSLVDGVAMNHSGSDRAVGIVDPFREGWIRKGDLVWVCMYPGSIVSLRHEWVHPVLDAADPPDFDVAYEYIVAAAEKCGMSFDVFMERVEELCETGDSWVEGGSQTAVDGFDELDEDEFWRNFEVVSAAGKGCKRPNHPDWHQPSSCSC